MRVSKALQDLPAVPDNNRLLLNSGGRMLVLDVSELEWVKADRNYVTLHRPTGDIRLRCTMTRMLAALPEGSFARISRSLAVNLAHVQRVDVSGERSVLLHSGARLRIARRVDIAPLLLSMVGPRPS